LRLQLGGDWFFLWKSRFEPHHIRGGEVLELFGGKDVLFDFDAATAPVSQVSMSRSGA
jgi:hypothetical protein